MPRLTLIALLAAAGLSAAAPAAAAGLGSLYSCDAAGSRDTTGAVIGGLVGALAGSQVSRHERALGAALGAGIGAAIGNSIGCRMDRQAQQDARQAFQRALDTGRAQSWSDPQTGASGRIEVLGPASGGGGAPPTTSYAGRWRFAEGVAPAVRVSSVGGTWSATNRVNVRAAPNANAAIVDRLQAGEEFEVAGAAAGGWLAVLEDGLVQGYVARSVVQPTGGGYSGGGDCRLVQHTLSEPGQSTVKERFNACRDRSGEWNLTAA
jgi:surface antigen